MHDFDANERPISDVDELIRTLNAFGTNWIFRGHRCSSWRLESTLERCLGTRWTSDNAFKAEEGSLHLFKSKAHHYLMRESTPSEDSKLGWLSLMQHHGVPTRLLDFTQSPYIAMYFAIADGLPDSGDNFAIWAVNYRAIMQISIEKLKKMDRNFKFDYHEAQFEKERIFREIVDRFSYPILWVTEPARMNLRLERQAGTFLIPLDPKSRILDLSSDSEYNFAVNVKKITFAANLRDGLTAFLEKIHINATSLFSDIDGLAKDVRSKIEFYTRP